MLVHHLDQILFRNLLLFGLILFKERLEFGCFAVIFSLQFLIFRFLFFNILINFLGFICQLFGQVLGIVAQGLQSKDFWLLEGKILHVEMVFFHILKFSHRQNRQFVRYFGFQILHVIFNFGQLLCYCLRFFHLRLFFDDHFFNFHIDLVLPAWLLLCCGCIISAWLLILRQQFFWNRWFLVKSGVHVSQNIEKVGTVFI